MPYKSVKKRREKTRQWKKDNPDKVKGQKQQWRERKRAHEPEQDMGVRKSSLNLRSRTVYPGMKELIVLLTDYRKGPSPCSGNKPQELETQLAEHREKKRIRQREYRRKQADTWAGNPQGLAEHGEKERIRQREYRRKQAEKRKLESHCLPRKERIPRPQTQQQDPHCMEKPKTRSAKYWEKLKQNPQRHATYLEKCRIRAREHRCKQTEKQKLCHQRWSRRPRREYRVRQKRVKKPLPEEGKEPCDKCGLCLVCGGYATASWGHRVDRCFEEQELEEIMSEATSSVRSSMAYELNYLVGVPSEEEEGESDSLEDSNVFADMKRELNLSSEESSTGTEEEEEEIKKVLNRKRYLGMQGVSRKVKEWMYESTMSDMMSELGDELDTINRGFRNMSRAHVQFRCEDEVENAKEEYVKTLEVTGHLMSELEQWLL